jgi:hypothetical protein
LATQDLEDTLSGRVYIHVDLYGGGTAINIVVLLPRLRSVRREFKAAGHHALFVFTMFFNGGLVPTYMLINKLG